MTSEGIIERVEIFKGKGKIQPWYFRQVGKNGKIISFSEGYFSKWNAKRSAKKVAESLRVELVDTTKKPYKRFP